MDNKIRQPIVKTKGVLLENALTQYRENSEPATVSFTVNGKIVAFIFLVKNAPDLKGSATISGGQTITLDDTTGTFISTESVSSRLVTWVNNKDYEYATFSSASVTYEDDKYNATQIVYIPD